MDPWIKLMMDAVLELYPLPQDLHILEHKGPPPPRVKLVKSFKTDDQQSHSPSTSEKHVATVQCNRRITAEGWNQDVRHIEFTFDENLR